MRGSKGRTRLPKMTNREDVAVGFALLALLVSIVSLLSSVATNTRLNRFLKRYHNEYGRIENNDLDHSDGASSFSSTSLA